jgi:uroporphyrin-III C-methyltransferase
MWRELYFEPALDAVREHRHHALPELGHRLHAAFAPDPDPDGEGGTQYPADGHRPARTPLRAGRVTLVGAGPGGADLITVRGARALAAADVVLYDRLADPELLDLAPPAAQRIPVGKGKGFGATQDDINALLVDHAADGSHVVRLKGGDPFVFGRGGEEVEACAAAGLTVEVVPGVSSALAAPALAGIAVTDRRAAASFTVVTGHRADDSGEATRWEALARSGDTIVVLMAATTASAVAHALLTGGRPSDEPVAFVHGAATADQDVVVSSLANTADEGCPLPSPTVMVIGPVVSASSTEHRRMTPQATADVAQAQVLA